MIIKSTFNNCVIFNNDFHANSSHEQEKRDEAEEADETQSAELVEVQPSDEHTFMDCIAEKETAPILRQWLHLMMDPISSKRPKEKLIFLRAVSEAKVFTQKLSYKAYEREFGKISCTSYYEWMYRDLKYERDDIDALVEQFLQYLNQYSK
jgi:hypothetical protein